ncbi:T9SS type A sorting domain-containing protein [Spirosoma sp. HMF4905]|uniref:T9SS type A sorting domain-containing protein n=1 Tax=Spirosoma arboris TaxID=2682092 RepID=A0A7K1SMN3_9BACT|nr:glycoside hydrolase family 9 protein [Spirosoma arboris]MVM35052.1 T9SS type A sorting domain-containing protein [Spirosoma arboris]
MKQQIVWTLVWLLTSFRSLAAPPSTTEFIRVDQFGYLQNARKVAVVVSPQVGSNAGTPFNASTGVNQYQVRRWADDAVVFTGTLQVWRDGVTQTQSGDKGWWFDFSSVNTPGSYYIFDVGKNAGSYRFEIGDNVYGDVLKAAMRTYFYQRINFAKQPPYTDAKWADAATHEWPGQDRQATSRYAKGDMSTAHDLHGGWMDAGDMNKYVTFAEEPVALLLEAYRLNPTVFGDNFNIPESGNGIPDILDEVKWELDFMRRMQDATGTGGLFLKVGVDNYDESDRNGGLPPSADRRPRYYVPECTSSTLSGAAMFAVAGAVYRTIPGLSDYAQDMIARAEQAFNRAKITTRNFTYFETTCDDQDIRSGDADKPADIQRQSAVVAAIYLFEATGKADYKVFVDSQYNQIQPIANQWWGPYTMHVHTALLRYAANPAPTPTVAAQIRALKSQQNGVLSINDYTAKTDLYRAYMADAQYHWGSNQVRGNAGVANLDFVNFNVNPSNKALYREVAAEYLHWFHGVNAQGKVMLSNMGVYGAENSQNEIYHTWFQHGTDWDNALTSPKGPAPGYVPGGPNNMDQYDGTEGYLRNEPLQKRYKDWNTGFPENSWILTEVAIYNQAPYISLLSRLMTPTSDPTDTEPPTAPTNLVASDLSPYSVKLTWTGSTDNRGVTAYEVYQNDTKIAETPETNLNITTLSPSNSYTFTVKAIDFSANRSNASNAVTVNTPAPSPNDFIIYGDALKSTIADWSWNSNNNPGNTDPVKLGQKSLKVNVTTAWGGLSLRNSEVLNTASYPGGLQFWFYGTDKRVRVNMSQVDVGSTTDFYNITAEPNTWTLVRIPWSEWGNPAQIQRISITDGSGSTQSFVVDDIRLVAGTDSQDNEAPTAPTNLATSNVTTTGLRLTWTASTDNVGITAYEVLQGSTVLNSNVVSTSLDVSGLSCNTSYNFTVRAKDAAGNISPNSNTVYVMTTSCTDTQAPSVPTNLVASNVTATSLTLTWTASTDNVGITAYEVYQNGVLLSSNVAGTSFNVSNLACGTTYTYTVLAKDAATNKSAASAATNAITLDCPPAQPTGSDVIYDESLNANWQEWGWSISSNYANTNPVKVNQKSLAISYTDGWGGWAITRTTYFVTTPQTTLRFWIYATTNNTIGVCTNSGNESGQSPYVSFQPTPNVWQEVVITMPQLANPAKIKRLTIQSQAPGANLIYVDNVRLEGSFNVTASNVTTTSLRLNWTASSGVTNVAGYTVYQNGILLNGSVSGTSLDVSGLTCGTGYSFIVRANDASGNGLITSVPLSVSTAFCAGSSAVEMIYDEAFNPGWDDWSWGLVTNYVNTNPVKVGQKSASLTFDGWGAWSIFRKTALSVASQSTIRFWMYPTTNKTLALTTYAENDSQASQTYSFQPTPNIWQEVVITMPQLGNPTRIKRLVLNMPTFGPNPIYLDNVRIETPNGSARVAASAEFPDEGRMTVSPNPATGPVRVQVLTGEAQVGTTLPGTLSVLNLAGMPIVSQSVSVESGLNEYTLDLSQVPAGLYLVQWQTSTKRLTQRLVLKK